jgi:haloalkane dehalogenase
VEVRRTPDARFDGLPDWPYAPRYTDVDGLRLARVDEGSGEPVVLVHGEPTWSYLYRGVIARLLGAGRRVVAPDHAGFGRSDKPADIGWYSYEAHSATFAAHLAALDLSQVTLVVHDWGGPIGLRWAMEHPERVARIVILNTGLFSGREASAGLDAWLAYARAQTDLAVGTLLDRACGGLPPDVVAAYDAPFPDVSSKAGALAFPRLVPTRMSDPGAAEQLRVREALDAWDGPVRVAFADADPIFPVAVGESWARRLRNAEPFTVIAGSGHFVPETQPAAVAAAVLGDSI